MLVPNEEEGTRRRVKLRMRCYSAQHRVQKCILSLFKAYEGNIFQAQEEDEERLPLLLRYWYLLVLRLGRERHNRLDPQLF
jgi:hypothetical protein